MPLFPARLFAALPVRSASVSRERHFGGRGAVASASWEARVCAEPEQLFSGWLRKWYKHEGSHRVAAVTIPWQDRGVDLIAKCTSTTNWFRRARNRMFGSTAHRAFETARQFLRCGISTPRPRLYLESQSLHSARQYLLMELIANSLTVEDFLKSRWPTYAPAARQVWLHRHAQELASQVRRMHAFGYDHRDLKFSNLLVRDDLEDTRVWLLDLEGVCQRRHLATSRAVQNLSRIAVSSLLYVNIHGSDRLRFLRAYLGTRFATEWKTWWRAIDRRARRKQTRNRQRGRPLT